MCPLKRSPLTIELALLGYFQRGPSYGYEIFQEITRPEGLGLIWRIKQSQVYALLDRLERAGLVNGMLETQENRPPRRLLSLTETGRKAFKEWVTAPVPQPRSFRREFLAKLFFALQDSPQTTRALIEHQVAVCQEWSGRVNRELNEKAAKPVFANLVYSYRAEQINTIDRFLKVCHTLLDDVKSGRTVIRAGMTQEAGKTTHQSES